jgi:hypothetical protein
MLSRLPLTERRLRSISLTRHIYTAAKARFFGQLGFELAAWETLAQALREHAQQHEVRIVTDTPFGPRYEIRGELYSPDGRSPIVCTIWQMNHGKVAPRLITAFLSLDRRTQP